MDIARNTRSTTNLILAAGLGALAMYVFDPQQGRRRVALARDRLVRLAHTGRETGDVGGRDLAHRATGWLARARQALRRGPPDDDVLVDRVRAQLGRWVSHPHAVEVSAASGRVTLDGPILQSEERRLLQAVQSVRGVREVENRLEAHPSANHVPALQGGTGRPQPRMEFMQENWAPGPRLLALGAGASLAWYGFARRGLPGTLAGIAGVGLAARAVANKDLGRLLGVSGGRRGVEIQKTIHIAAPRDRVFELWSNVDNFPRFMSLVQEVRQLDDTRSHWVVRGPAGTRVEWDSVITQRLEPSVLAWRSEPGSPVQHAGIVRFDDEAGGTRAMVRLSYNPPGGVLGHAVAALLGRDPKREMDADLARMKMFIETGVAPRDAAQRAAMSEPPERRA